MKPLLILISLLTIALEANAQNWVRTAGPVEDDVFDLCIDSNGTIYATTPLGVNRSTNNGDEWTRPFLFPQPTTINRIVIAPNGNIIASAAREMFVSTDGGITFTTSRSDSIDNHVVQFAISGSGRIFAVLKHTFLISDNHGATWTDAPRTGMSSGRCVAIAAIHDTVICMNEHSFYVSVDNGNTWQSQNGFFQSSSYPRLVIHPNGTWLCYMSSYALYQYAQDQDNWTLLPAGPTSAIFGTDIMPNGDVLVSAQDGVMRLKNLTSWSNISLGLPWDTLVKYIPIYRFAYSPKSNLYYAATFGAGVWKSASVLQNTNVDTEPLAFSVSPNPFTDRTTVHFSEANPSWSELELRNILGVVVWKKAREYSVSGLNTLPIEVSGIPAGNYLLVLRTNERTETQWVTIVE